MVTHQIFLSMKITPSANSSTNATFYTRYKWLFTEHQHNTKNTGQLIFSIPGRKSFVSLPNSEGITAVKTSLQNFTWRIVVTKVISIFLSLILTLSNFVFNCKKVFPNKRLCHKNNLPTSICWHLHGKFSNKIYLKPSLEGHLLLLKIHWPCILYMDR